MCESRRLRIDVVDRVPTPVIYAASAGDWSSIPAAASRAFALLEAAIFPRGRKMYGYWYPPGLEYRACYARHEGDAPRSLGLEEGVIAGSRYRRARIQGEGAFGQIPGAYTVLEHLGDVNVADRPWFEFYRRHDRVDVFVPISLQRHLGSGSMPPRHHSS